MPSSRRRYDWVAIQLAYDGGQSASACRAEFEISSGAWHSAVQRGDLVLRASDQTVRPRGATRAQVEALIGEGLTQAEIAARLGVSRPTVCFHMRRLGLGARAAMARRYDWDAIRSFYLAGHSMRECQRQLASA